MKSNHQEWKQICVELKNWNSNKVQYYVQKYTDSRNILPLKEQRNERKIVLSSQLAKTTNEFTKAMSVMAAVAGTAVAMNLIVCSVDNDDGDDVDMTVFFIKAAMRGLCMCVLEVHICKNEMPC